MKTISWGSVPNSVRCWCAAQMMANKAEMETGGTLTVVKLRASRKSIKGREQVSSLLHSRVMASFARVTLLKPYWFTLITGLNGTSDHLDVTVVFLAPGLANHQIEHICHHLSRLYKCVVSADRYSGAKLSALDFKAMFDGLNDEDSIVASSRETINLATHQIHVEVARENGQPEPQLEIPMQISEEAHAELTAMGADAKPTIKDNWIVGWQLIGSAVRQFALESFARLSLGKSFSR